jgi:hypothetical protein
VSLKTTVSVPFRQHGRRYLGEGEFVVALSLDRDWFSPEQAKRLLDVAAGRGLLERDGEELRATFDPGDVAVPEGFVPDESLLNEQSTFEQLLAAVVETGVDKQAAVAAINHRQHRLGVTIEAAAVLEALERGVDVGEMAARARTDLLAKPAGDGDESGDGEDDG